MNNQQQHALAALEVAFADAKAAGLVFIGMDNRLLAFDRKQLETAGYFKPQRNVTNILRELGQGDDVDTSGTYLDSGGW